MSKRETRRDLYDLPVKNVEVVPRLTPERPKNCSPSIGLSLNTDP